MPQSVWNERFPARDLYLEGKNQFIMCINRARIPAGWGKLIQWAEHTFSISLVSPKLLHHFLLTYIFIPVIFHLTQPFLQLQTYNQWKMPRFSLLICIPCLLLFFLKNSFCCFSCSCVQVCALCCLALPHTPSSSLASLLLSCSRNLLQDFFFTLQLCC